MAVPEPIRTPLAQRLKRVRIGFLPLAIWLASAALAVRLWTQEPRAPAYLGLAHAPEIRVTSPVDARVDRVLVELYQTVGAGEPLATLGDGELTARIETARAELQRLAAELESERAAIEAADARVRHEAAAREDLAAFDASLRFTADLRAFHEAQADLQLSLLDTRLAITTSEMEADRIELGLKRAEQMARNSIGPRAEVEDMEKRRAIELARADNLRGIEAGLQAELELARDRRRAMEASYGPPPAAVFGALDLEPRLASWRAAITVQEKRLDELDLLRSAFLLRAPAAGRIAALHANSGQFLLAGDPVLVLVDPKPRAVALWVPEIAPDPPRIGDRVLVRHARRSELGAAECVVQTLSPRVELLPQRLWRDARMPEYGRTALLGPVSALELVPGERVHVDRLEGSLAATK